MQDGWRLVQKIGQVSDVAAVALDLENEILTPDAARRIYGRVQAAR